MKLETQRHFLLAFPPRFSRLRPCKRRKYFPIQTKNNQPLFHDAVVFAPPVHQPPTFKSAYHSTAFQPRSTDKKCRPVSTSLRTTGSTEVQLVGDVINYTYIDRNSIHYSWASHRQSYFPPSQKDEKILNNSTRLQTSAFQRRRLTLKRLKVGAAVLAGNHHLGPNVFQTVGSVQGANYTFPGRVGRFSVGKPWNQLCLSKRSFWVFFKDLKKSNPKVF